MKMERDALLREVDEELRRDQAHKIWEQYGTYIVGGVIALLVCVGGYKWWQGRQVVASERALKAVEPIQYSGIIITSRSASASATAARFHQRDNRD